VSDARRKNKCSFNLSVCTLSDRCTRLVKANKKLSLERQADLEEQLQKTRNNYNLTTKNYLKQEKVFREEK